MQKYFCPRWDPIATPGYQTGRPTLYFLAVPQDYVPENNKQGWWQCIIFMKDAPKSLLEMQTQISPSDHSIAQRNLPRH